MRDAHLLGDLLRLAVDAAIGGHLETDQLATGPFQQVAGQDRVGVDIAVGIGVAHPQIAVLVVQPHKAEPDAAAVVDGVDNADRLRRIDRRAGFDRRLMAGGDLLGIGRGQNQRGRCHGGKGGAHNQAVAFHCVSPVKHAPGQNCLWLSQTWVGRDAAL